jgi:predicted RNA methylase
MKTRHSGMPPEFYWETFYNPSQILTALGLRHAEGPVVDIGAGCGTFTLAVARLTGQPVIGIDIEQFLLEDLARKLRAEKLDKVQLMLRDVMLEGTGFAGWVCRYRAAV